MKYIIVTVLIAFAVIGCKPSKEIQQSRAEAFYRDNPLALAVKCAEEYPVKDSIGAATIDSIASAFNTNYQGLIDSLNFEAQRLTYILNHDTTILAAWYRDQIGALRDRIAALNSLYKPCQPEIIYQTKPVYRENTARAAAYSLLADNLKLDTALKGAEIRAVKARMIQCISEKETYAKRARNRLFGLIGLGAVMIGGGVLAFKLI